MSPRGLSSLAGAVALPADAIAALRKLPEIAENTRVMREHTAALERVAEALERVSGDTAVLREMDERMAAIEAAMPVLVEVQGHLAQLPETMGRLAKLPRIAGVKDATANLARVDQQLIACGSDFIQLSGEDATALAFNAHGGVGCISSRGAR